MSALVALTVLTALSGLQTTLAILGALVALAAVGGGLWAVFRTAAQDATIERLRTDNAEYIKRIEYIEPRWKAADEQNTLLRELHNPSAQLGRLEDKSSRTVELLEDQHELLNEIAAEMHRRGPRDGNPG